jgi:hypothetical protein
MKKKNWNLVAFSIFSFSPMAITIHIVRKTKMISHFGFQFLALFTIEINNITHELPSLV